MLDQDILKMELFPVILDRIKQRRESLVNIGKFPVTGIEGWFRVEVVAALANSKHAVKQLRNKGPDLLLNSGFEIELKGATDFNISYLRSELKKHGTFLLFLQNGVDRERINKLKSFGDVEIICYEAFSDSLNEWILGLIKPF